MKRSEIEELFDIVGKEFDSKNDYFNMHKQQMYRFCSYCFEEERIEGRICLDAGCGTGTANLYFTQNGAKQVYGIDLSRKSLEVAKHMSLGRGILNAQFSIADMYALPFKDQTFDVVFSCGALPYVENIFHSISELIRVTRIDGSIVLMVLIRTRLDGFYEFLRSILCRIPGGLKINAAAFIAAVSHFVAPIFLKRRVCFSIGKPLKQIIMEALFSPVKLQKAHPEDIQAFFESKGLRIRAIDGIKDVDFYSPQTCFVIKATRSYNIPKPQKAIKEQRHAGYQCGCAGV